jgi:hypothetical protein
MLRVTGTTVIDGVKYTTLTTWQEVVSVV